MKRMWNPKKKQKIPRTLKSSVDNLVQIPIRSIQPVRVKMQFQQPTMRILNFNQVTFRVSFTDCHFFVFGFLTSLSCCLWTRSDVWFWFNHLSNFTDHDLSFVNKSLERSAIVSIDFVS